MAPHILIVDADVSAANITAATIQRIVPTASVTCERTPEHGWLSAQRVMPDALIIDPSPHSPGGTLLIQLCKEAQPSLRVVVLASAPSPTLRTRVQQIGIDEYLEKPVALAHLADQLRAMLPVVPAPPAASSPAFQPV